MNSNQPDIDEIRTYLVTELARGEFCSGETLGEHLGISRAAVSNHIKYLNELGLDIYRLQGKGYRLANPLTLLDKNKILEYQKQADSQKLIVLNIIDSTNQYIKEHQLDLPNGFVCLAEAQTAGRGRRGRTWVSPYGASMYLSMHWTFTSGYQSLGGLSLAVGVAIVKALEKINVVDAKVKWPNDIYVFNKKLAGVLIEVEGQIGAACHCVIGLGINVKLPTTMHEIDQPYIDISGIIESSVDRNYFAAILIEELKSTMLLFEAHGLHPFIAAWKASDVFANQAINLLMGDNRVSGIARGIDDSGALLLETAEGIRAYQGGEISVRSA